MDLFARAEALHREGVAAAMVVVIEARGSCPRHAGARMLVTRDGSIFGTIGGGRVEQVIVAEAVEVATGNVPRRVFHNLVRDLEMACGGAMEFFLAPIAPIAADLGQVSHLLARRCPVELTTRWDGAVGVVALDAPDDQRGTAPALRREPDRLVEVLVPSDRLVLFGCGHVGRAIGPLAVQVGFEVVVCDDGDHEPPEWADRWIPSFDVAEVERVAGRLGSNDYAVLVTRAHAIDLIILEALLPRSLRYLGMIGSKRKVEEFRRALTEKGIATPERWQHLHAPIGLTIGAETPEEIAVSVVAQLIATRRSAE